MSWRWRYDTPLPELSGRGGQTQAGVIAQDVRAVFPDLVVENESGYLMVDYGGLARMVAAAVEELRSRTEQLERLGASSVSDERAKAGANPLAEALERLGDTPTSLTSEDVQALVGAMVEAVKALDVRIGALEAASASSD